MRRVLVAPSILSADFGRLAEEIATLRGADWIHLDVMDGRFVPNITIGPAVVAACRRATSLPLDVHLMVEEPGRYVRAFREAGADRITVHVEACVHLHRVLQQVRASGAAAGVALNPHTPDSVLDYVLDQVDLVLLMTVNPGFGGQALIGEVLPKVSRVRAAVQARGLPVLVQVDGGVKPENAAAVIGAGADVLVSGSGVFGAPDRAAAIETLREAGP